MEIVFSILLGLCAGYLTTMFTTILHLVINLVSQSFEVNRKDLVTKLDIYFSENGWCERRSLDEFRSPGKGVCIGWIGGPFIAYRTDHYDRGELLTCYNLTLFTKNTMEQLNKKLLVDNNKVKYIYVYAHQHGHSYTAVEKDLPGVPYKWQEAAARQVVDKFRENSSATCLISGPMGAGKSSLVDYIADILKKEFKIKPNIVANLPLTAQGYVFGGIIAQPTLNSPVLINLNEIDSVIRHAEAEAGEKVQSIAGNPVSLLDFFDRLNISSNTIVIGSTNLSLNIMNSGIYARYVRKGRFDIHFEAY